MSLQETIIVEEGEEVPSFGKVLRTACFITLSDGRKIMNSRDFQTAIRLNFSNNLGRNAVYKGVSSVMYYTSTDADKLPDNFKEFNDKVKSIIPKFGVEKVNKNAIFYMVGIYLTVKDYELETFEYNNTFDIKDIIRLTNIIVEHYRKNIIKETHLDFLKKLMCPNQELNIVWSIDKTVENMEIVLKEYNYHSEFHKSFIQKLIYNFDFMFFSNHF